MGGDEFEQHLLPQAFGADTCSGVCHDSFPFDYQAIEQDLSTLRRRTELGSAQTVAGTLAMRRIVRPMLVGHGAEVPS